MSPTPPDYHTSRTIGTGRSNPADVLRLRRALTRLGYGRFGNPPAENVTPGLMDATERFQADFGLKPDSVITLGGPTERALSMALRARNEGGDDSLADLRDAFALRAAAGLTFSPHPKDRNTGLWRDSTGRALADTDADAIAARTTRQRTQLAMMTRRDKHRLPGQGLLEGGGGGGGFRRGNMDAGDLLRGIFNRVIQGDSAPKRSVAEPPPDVPPFPAEPLESGEKDNAPVPPPRFPNRLEFPSEPPEPPEDGGKPVDDPKRPDKLIFTSLEDDEFWRQVSILKRWGDEETKELNDRTGQFGVELGKEYGRKLKMTHGGFGVGEDGKKGKYQTELLLRPGEKLKVAGRPLVNASWLDVVLTDEETGVKIMINTADTYARTGALKPREKKQEAKVMENMDTKDIFIWLPKPRGEVDLGEYVKTFESELRKAIERLPSPPGKG